MAEDHGVLGEVSINNQLDSSCADTSTMDWKLTGGITARDSSSEAYDEIEKNGSKIWKFDAHFENKPNNLVHDVCDDDYYEAKSGSFEYFINVPDDEDNNRLYLTNPEPDDGDGSSENDELGLALDIVAGVTGTYASIGSILVDYAMDGGATVTNDRGQYTFDVDLDNSSDLPQEKDGDAVTAEASLRVENEYDPGTDGTVEFQPAFTFK